MSIRSEPKAQCLFNQNTAVGTWTTKTLRFLLWKSLLTFKTSIHVIITTTANNQCGHRSCPIVLKQNNAIQDFVEQDFKNSIVYATRPYLPSLSLPFTVLAPAWMNRFLWMNGHGQSLSYYTCLPASRSYTYVVYAL